MEFISICGAAAICCGAVLLFAGREKELSSLIASLIYVVIILYGVTRIGDLLTSLQSYLSGIESVPHLALFLKIGGIAIVGTIASVLCENAGQKGAAGAIDLLTVLEILYMSIPVIQEFIDRVFRILGE